MPASARLALAMGAVLAAASARVEAAEFCVTCAAPDASYRCETGDSGAAWLRCITELAKEGGHDSCSVDRSLAPPCPGLHKILADPPPGAAPPSFPVQAAIPQPAPAPASPQSPPATEPDPAAPAQKRVPQTMQELAGDTFESSKEGLKKAGQSVSDTAKKAGEAVTDSAKSAGEGLSKAGNAVGNAAKKTWDCVTSLFQTC